ncbi:T6SS effector BTH_I2691 family protein, partial [Pseudomonas sp.]|uniref:T6SS effector BTH_I2691 family protein n=1 Tax=Pseudomonas sp. TaxID=306 RepID=UPI00289C5817
MWSMKNKIAASAVKSVSPCEQGSCKNCDKPGLLVHPFRYSAFCSDDESIIERIPPLRPASGGSLPELTQSKYAIRMMREGYIYVVLVRNGLKYIDSYYVRPSGRLMRFRETPPERKTSDMACQRMANSPNALMVAIDAPEEVSMSYWLFTPDPLSNNKEQELLSTAEELLSTGALQGFSPQKWINQRQSDQYMLSPATISYFVLEYMVASQIAGYSIGQVPMIRALDEQPFPALCDSQDPPLPPAFTADQLGPFYQSRLNASLPVLRESVELLRSQDGVGIALQDPIGITQELNAWRNRAMEGLEEWMHTVDKFGVDNQWKYLAARQYADIREGLLSGRITASERATIEASNSSIDKTVCDLEAQRGMPGALDPGPMIEIAQATKDSDPFGFRKAEINAARSRVLERFRAAEANLDGGQTSILADFDARAELCEMAVQQRAANHLAWLKGNMLILALRFYDQSDFIQGWAFAIQVGLATNGMDSEEKSKQVIDDWWRSIRKSEVAER